MTTLQLDNNNNLVFQSNFLTLSGKEAIRQDIKNLLLMFKGEYPFNVEMGINYYDLLTWNNKDYIKNQIKERILTDKRIKAIYNLQIGFNQKSLNVNMDLETTEGAINV